MKRTDTLYIDFSRAAHGNDIYIVSINLVDEHGVGSGDRLSGPKYGDGYSMLAKIPLDDRAVDAIHRYTSQHRAMRRRESRKVATDDGKRPTRRGKAKK